MLEDLLVPGMREGEIPDLISSVADTERDRLKLMIIEAHIAAWAKGQIPDEDGKVYLKMLYHELKKIREKNEKRELS